MKISPLVTTSMNNIDIKKANNDKKLKELSNEFESIFLKQLLDVALKDSSYAGNGAGKEIILGMYTQELARASSGGLGFSNMLYEYLSSKNKTQG